MSVVSETNWPVTVTASLSFSNFLQHIFLMCVTVQVQQLLETVAINYTDRPQVQTQLSQQGMDMVLPSQVVVFVFSMAGQLFIQQDAWPQCDSSDSMFHLIVLCHRVCRAHSWLIWPYLSNHILKPHLKFLFEDCLKISYLVLNKNIQIPSLPRITGGYGYQSSKPLNFAQRLMQHSKLWRLAVWICLRICYCIGIFMGLHEITFWLLGILNVLGVLGVHTWSIWSNLRIYQLWLCCHRCFTNSHVITVDFTSNFYYRFNYRSTHYMSEHGFYNFLNWFDDRAWYPLGRIVGGTVCSIFYLKIGTSNCILYCKTHTQHCNPHISGGLCQPVSNCCLNWNKRS